MHESERGDFSGEIFLRGERRCAPCGTGWSRSLWVGGELAGPGMLDERDACWTLSNSMPPVSATHYALGFFAGFAIP